MIYFQFTHNMQFFHFSVFINSRRYMVSFLIYNPRYIKKRFNHMHRIREINQIIGYQIKQYTDKIIITVKAVLSPLLKNLNYVILVLRPTVREFSRFVGKSWEKIKVILKSIILLPCSFAMKEVYGRQRRCHFRPCIGDFAQAIAPTINYGGPLVALHDSSACLSTLVFVVLIDYLSQFKPNLALLSLTSYLRHSHALESSSFTFKRQTTNARQRLII